MSAPKQSQTPEIERGLPDAARPVAETALAVLIATVVAALVLLPGLGAHGLWSDGELAVLDRARAALGEPLSGLERSPWLPDALRARSYALLAERLGGDFALRLPGAIACCLLVGISAGLGRMRGGSRRMALFAGLFALAFPATLMSGRTVLGNPIGEFAGVLAVVASVGALGPGPRHLALRIAYGVVALAALLGSVLSTGIVIGGVLPVCVVALLPGQRGWRRWVSVALWVAALASGAVAVELALGQGEGFIPLLGAAKDLDLISNPHRRGFADSLEEYGFAIFPWIPLALIGALASARDRWPGVWILIGLGIVSSWSMAYGRTPVPLVVPTALCCAAGLAHLFDARQTRVSRRFAMLLITAGLLILGKDAKREPHRVGSPLLYFPAGLDYPDDRIHSDRIFGGQARVSLLMLLAAFAISRRSRADDLGARPAPGLLERLGDRIPPSVRQGLPYSLVGALLTAQALQYARIVVPRTSAQLSAKGTMGRQAAWAQRGLIPTTFAAHRIRDPGLVAYGPGMGEIVNLTSRSELTTWLASEEPAVALIRRSELAPLHAKARQNPWHLYVLDERHHDLVLVGNFLPEGLEDQNPLPAVVLDTPPVLAHETMVRFEKYVEVIGWEIDEPVVRGSKATMRLVLKPLRHLPAGTQIYARLQKGKMSRINAAPHALTNGVYPPNNWRDGDFILHEFEFEVPTLEILSGPHEFIVGLRRSEKQNFSISFPEGEVGEFGVVVKGKKKREFAVIGEVDVL